MFKRLGVFSLILSILLMNNMFVLADDEIDNVEINGIEKVIQTASKAINEPKINSRYAIILDRKSKAILYGKNEMTKTKMASTTKIMTAIVVLENTKCKELLTLVVVMIII